MKLSPTISIIYRKQQREKLHKAIKTPPSYGTHQQDGITLPLKGHLSQRIQSTVPQQAALQSQGDNVFGPQEDNLDMQYGIQITSGIRPHRRQM